MTVRTRGRLLELPGNRKIRLRDEPLQVLEIGEVVVVRLRVRPGSINNENVLAFDREHGKLLWQIAPREHVYRDSPYTAISQEGPYVWAHNWDGADVKVEPRTGRVLEERYSK